MAGDYEGAIAQWRRLIEEFPDGSRAGWLLSMAEAYRKINEDDQAQLLLMRIRFRHRQSPVWPQAMRELAVISTERDEYEHAREVLEDVVSVYDANRYPETVLELARLYDHQPILRDYSKAVNYYREAAAVLEKKKPEQAKKARSRADYLVKNYIDFGTE
jgi:tetratricopeptide (TPR) repeat protein